MIVFLNGEFVPEDEAMIPVFDRSFLYGDGLFETMLVLNGRPFRWEQHLQRLQHGATLLRLRIPFPADELQAQGRQLIERNRMRSGILRLTLSRGVGPRGYSIQRADEPSLVMSLHENPPLDLEHPPRWNLATASIRVPANDVLATIKSCNKLPQIIARTEAEERGADEALLLNTDGHLTEGASSNLFWVEDDAVCTTPLASGALAGVTRAFVMELCQSLGWPTRERSAVSADLLRADGVFLTLSTLGIVEAVRLDGQALRRSARVEVLRQTYWRAAAEETH